MWLNLAAALQIIAMKRQDVSAGYTLVLGLEAVVAVALGIVLVVSGV